MRATAVAIALGTLLVGFCALPAPGSTPNERSSQNASLGVASIEVGARARRHHYYRRDRARRAREAAVQREDEEAATKKKQQEAAVRKDMDYLLLPASIFSAAPGQPATSGKAVEVPQPELEEAVPPEEFNEIDAALVDEVADPAEFNEIDSRALLNADVVYASYMWKLVLALLAACLWFAAVYGPTALIRLRSFQRLGKKSPFKPLLMLGSHPWSS